jgi:hypothetical protein
LARAFSLSWRGAEGDVGDGGTSIATGRWRRRSPLAAGRRSWAGAEPVAFEELEQNLLFFFQLAFTFGLFYHILLTVIRITFGQKNRPNFLNVVSFFCISCSRFP